MDIRRCENGNDWRANECPLAVRLMLWAEVWNREWQLRSSFHCVFHLLDSEPIWSFSKRKENSTYSSLAARKPSLKHHTRAALFKLESTIDPRLTATTKFGPHHAEFCVDGGRRGRCHVTKAFARPTADLGLLDNLARGSLNSRCLLRLVSARRYGVHFVSVRP